MAPKLHYMIFILINYSGTKINQGELQGNQAAYIKQKTSTASLAIFMINLKCLAQISGHVYLGQGVAKIIPHFSEVCISALFW